MAKLLTVTTWSGRTARGSISANHIGQQERSSVAEVIIAAVTKQGHARIFIILFFNASNFNDVPDAEFELCTKTRSGTLDLIASARFHATRG